MKVLIAAGGTGGHILPAIAVGSVLSGRGVTVDYLCGERDVELALYRQHNLQPLVVPARQLGRGLGDKLRGLGAAMSNVVRCARLIHSRQYAVVVGMGGYVAGPALAAALCLRRPTLIHEANSVMGKTNRLLAPFVSQLAVNFESCVARSRLRRNTVVVGMPIRSWLLNGSRSEACRIFDLDPTKKTLLVVGGSQGARRLYEFLLETLPLLDGPDVANLQILWSGGTANFEWVAQRLSAMNLRYLQVRLIPYIEHMEHALAVADAAIARAGASTIAELLASGIYALYVPLPSAIYDHQRLNAEQVVRAGAGRMVLESELTPERLKAEIHELLTGAVADRSSIARLGELHRRAAERLAEEIVALAK